MPMATDKKQPDSNYLVRLLFENRMLNQSLKFAREEVVKLMAENLKLRAEVKRLTESIKGFEVIQ